MATPKIVEQQLQAAEQLQQDNLQGNGPQPEVVTDISQLANPAPPAVATPPQQTQQPSVPDAWEQKYRSLKGIFDQKVPELQAQVATQSSQVTALTEQVRTLTEVLKHKAAEPDKPQKPANDPRDVEQFGGDLVDMVQRYAGQILNHVDAKFAGAVQHLEGRVERLEASVNGVKEDSAATRESQFYAMLKQLVPDYEEVNRSDFWLNWLGQVDGVYGVARQAALDAAVNRKDAPRVAAIFNEFKAVAGPSAENQVQPVTVGGAPAPRAPAPKPYLTQKVVQQFYNDTARGRYRGREADAERLEAEINAAIAEGRITP